MDTSGEFGDFSLRWRSQAFRGYKFIKSLADSAGLSDVIDALARVHAQTKVSLRDVTRR
jgi:hypothetical protein